MLKVDELIASRRAAAALFCVGSWVSVGCFDSFRLDGSGSFGSGLFGLDGSLLGWLMSAVRFWDGSSDIFDGEFDPGSGRTLAACLTHASRAVRPFGVHERRTGE